MGVLVGRVTWRTGIQVLAAVTVLAGLPAIASAATGPPPGGPDLAAARHAVAQRAAAVGRAANSLAAATSRLSQLEAQVETLVERYNGAVVALARATEEYRAAQARFSSALRAESARRSAVAQLASNAYETEGSFGSVAAVIGGEGGPQGSFDRAGIVRLLAEHDTDILASAEASRVVAEVFRSQAQTALRAKQAAASRAATLKNAAKAAVAAQQQLVRASQATKDRLERRLSAAQATERALEAQAAAAAARAAEASAQSNNASTTASSEGTQAPAWAFSAGASATQGDIAANWALQQLGKPYVWAAAGPDSFDCSGLTMRAWEQAGVQLDHWTGTQWTSGPHIPISQLRRGDLVFFANDTSDPATIHHVGIYIGQGMMVDAPYTGVDVRIDTIYEPGLIGATRPA